MFDNEVCFRYVSPLLRENSDILIGRKNMKKKTRPSTRSVHAGRRYDKRYFSINVPIIHSSPFYFKNTADQIKYFSGKSNRTQPEYGRMGNPTISAVEKRLAALEGGETAQLFASGMAAVTTMLITLLQKGDHIVITDDSYRRTRDFISNFLSKFGIQSSIVPTDAKAIRQRIRRNTRIIFSECPTNPYLKVIDVGEVARVGRSRKILTVIDSTMATPINLKPLEHGIDMVLHSATKYLGGHNDIIGGVLIGSKKMISPIAEMHMTIGGISDPTTAFLLDRGLKTLAVRVDRHNENGLRVAEYLESHPKILRVFYPGLKSHPDHEPARSQMKGFGGVVSFLVKGKLDDVCRFVDRLEIPRITPSFGGVDSLVDQPAIMSYWDVPKREREKMGIYDNLVRLSPGIEDAEDLIEDLNRALKRV